MEGKEMIFTGRTAAEARASMHSALGTDSDRIELVRTRQLRKGGIFGLGGSTVWEIVARSVAPRGAGGVTGGRVPRRPGHFAAKAYARSAGAAAAPGTKALHADAGASAGGVEGIALQAEVAAMRRQIEEMARRMTVRARPDVCQELLDVYAALVENEIAEGLAKCLVERVQQDLAGTATRDRQKVVDHLMGLLADLINTGGPIRLRKGRTTTVALIGPTGVGKTTTVAKLAARFALLEGKRVALVTTDTYRLAAVDQLYRYGELMRIPVREVSSPAKVRGVLQDLGEMDLVLIDTAGRSQFDDIKMNDLRVFLDAARPDETHLLVSGAVGHRGMVSTVERFSQFPLDRVIFTKLDEAVGCGLMITVLLQLRKSLSYVTTGQNVPDDIEVGDAGKLARMLIGRALNVVGAGRGSEVA